MATRSPSGSAAKKSATKKSTTKRSAPRSTDGSSEEDSQEEAPRRRSAPRASAPKRATASQAASSAAALAGREAEGVTGLERTEDGWTVKVEVVEVRRIPDTTDVLALYDVDVDSDGDLLGYRRVRRYTRGVPGED